jgi:hypothetical protein
VLKIGKKLSIKLADFPPLLPFFPAFTTHSSSIEALFVLAEFAASFVRTEDDVMKNKVEAKQKVRPEALNNRKCARGSVCSP